MAVLLGVYMACYYHELWFVAAVKSTAAGTPSHICELILLNGEGHEELVHSLPVYIVALGQEIVREALRLLMKQVAETEVH